ncbi:transporter, major facilitator family protein [Actinomyces graevenitzii F0530]|jgi:ozmA|uniref:Transporter, major facilitator family protein n=1 Tax=Actinomyces graevenitzii F0530 TaxID=1321817 RepID=U1PVF6_9ACTO|nr:MFS transporter [Actinomyces graevenitzii]ERH14139.1 transporter, major facilitator family protein [Actinomyces graevenitzii F0530]
MSATKRSTAAVMTALLVACFAFQLNASMLSPALRLMAKELKTTDDVIGLTQTVFFTAAALFSLFLPRLGDMIGRRKLLTGMMALTAVGCALSALAGMTGSVALLFVGRVIQGVAGPTVPVCLIMLRVAVPDPKRYGTLLGVITAVNGGIAGVDALAGGWLAQNFGFGSVFWTMAVIAVLAAVAVAFLTDESLVPGDHRMDWTGTIALVVAVGALLTIFNELAKLFNANFWLVAGLFLLAALSAVAFWIQEDRTSQPLVATVYLQSRSTWALLLTTTLTMTGVFAVMNGLVPGLAQDTDYGPGLSPDVVSFWTLTPYAIAGLLMGPVSGTLAGRFGYRKVLRVGLLGTVIGLGAILAISPSATPVLLLAVNVFVGITYAGMSNIMLNGLGVVLSPSDNPGYLPGLNAGAFNLGAGISFAILPAVSVALGNGLGGFQGAVITGLVLLALAFASSLLIPAPAVEKEAAA